jgi:hypothetical protein
MEEEIRSRTNNLYAMKVRCILREQTIREQNTNKVHTHPGIMPRPVSGSPNTASSPTPSCLQTHIRYCHCNLMEFFHMQNSQKYIPQIRRSQARDISKPPPRAAPSTTAMVGMDRFCKVSPIISKMKQQ